MSSEHIFALPAGHRLTAGDRKIDIKKLLGHGNFGLTYLACDNKLDRYVAVKEMLPLDFAWRPNNGTHIVARSPSLEASLAWARERFLDEARTLAKLHHHSILPIYDFFEANGTAYLVSPFIEGVTLETWLQKRGRPTEKELRDILRTLLEALKLVHAAEVLHRDIKTENILIESKNHVPVLIDFGNARVATGMKTSNLSAILTQGYAPFEQYQTRGKQGPWTDLYAMGAVFYRAVTGEVPPWSTDRLGVDTIVRLAASPAVYGYSASFLGMIDKALQLLPQERWQTCTEWLRALDADVPQPPPPPPPPPPPFPWLGLSIGTLAVLGAGTLGWFTLGPGAAHTGNTPQGDDKVPLPKEVSKTQLAATPTPPAQTPIPAPAVVPATPAPAPPPAAPGITVEHAGAMLTDDVSMLQFPASVVGEATTLAITVKNSGTAPLEGLRADLDGAHKLDFDAVAPRDPLDPGKTVTITVNFKPAASGHRQATLLLHSNVGGAASPFEIKLAGQGTPAQRSMPPIGGSTPNSIGMSFASVQLRDLAEDGTSAVAKGNLLVSVNEVRNCDIARWRPELVPAGANPDAAYVGITPENAEAFCEWLNTQEKGLKYRLLTDHEWSCAAGLLEKSSESWESKRSKNSHVFPWSDGQAWTARLDSLDPLAYGNYSSHTLQQSQSRPKANLTVGRFSPNAFGLYDMGGNVCELCADPNTPGKYVLRGGSWSTAPAGSGDSAYARTHRFDFLSASHRLAYGVAEPDETGFRIALDMGR